MISIKLLLFAIFLILVITKFDLGNMVEPVIIIFGCAIAVISLFLPDKKSSKLPNT